MLLEETFNRSLNISFNTFASPRATVTLYRQQEDSTYQPHTDDRITATDSYIAFTYLLPLDSASYLITATNNFGQSINNLTFDVFVIVPGKLVCVSMNIVCYWAAIFF